MPVNRWYRCCCCFFDGDILNSIKMQLSKIHLANTPKQLEMLWKGRRTNIKAHLRCPDLSDESHQDKNTHPTARQCHNTSLRNKTHAQTLKSREVHQPRHDRPSHSMTVSEQLFLSMPRIRHYRHPQSSRHLQLLGHQVQNPPSKHNHTSIRSPLSSFL